MFFWLFHSILSSLLNVPQASQTQLCPRLNSSSLLSLLHFFLANDIIHYPGTSVRNLSCMIPSSCPQFSFSNPHLKSLRCVHSLLSTAIALVETLVILTFITSLLALNPAPRSPTYCFQSDHSKMQTWSFYSTLWTLPPLYVSLFLVF